MTFPYKKQELRQQKTSTQSATSKIESQRALAAKVLTHPELFPDEFKAWLPRWMSRNVNFKVDVTQLPVVEPRKLVGGTGNAAFLNSWTNYGSVYQEAAYYKDPLGRVHVMGLIASGSIGSPAFTLPAGYRPEKSNIFTSITVADAIARVDVSSSGDVIPQTGNNGYISLEFSFRQFA